MTELAGIFHTFRRIPDGFAIGSDIFTLPTTVSEVMGEELLRRKLASWFYVNLHCRMSATSTSVVRARDEDFINQICEAVTSRYAWDANWLVLEKTGGLFAVQKAGLLLYVSQEQVAEDDLDVGNSATLRLGPIKRSAIPGFVHVSGEQQPPPGLPNSDLRVYWNATSQGAIRFAQVAPEILDREQVVFSFKALDAPAGYGRTDAVVLYIWSMQLPNIAAALRALYDELEPYLHSDVSAFVHQLAPGVGVAMEPDSSHSFGQFVSAQLAAHLLVKGDLGLDLARPYQLREHPNLEGLKL